MTIGVAYLAWTAAQAWAARLPSPQEKAAIISAVKQGSAPALRSRYDVRDVLVSTVGPYARGKVVGVGIYSKTIQQAWALLQGSGRDWHVRDITGSLDCAEAPPEVFKDLKLSCVGPPSPPSPPPPDAKCDDLATISPSLGKHAELATWHLPSFASVNLPLAVKATVQLGGMGVCQKGLSLLTAGVGSPVLPQVSLKADYSGSQPVFRFDFDPLGWEVPSGTGAPADQSLIPTFDWSNAIELSAGPQFDLSYGGGEPVDAELSFLRVDAFPLKVVLVSHGTAFLDATVGPQLSVGLGIDKKALAKKIAERVAGGEDPATATDDIAQEADQEINSGIERSVAKIAPFDVSAASFTSDVTVATDDFLVVLGFISVYAHLPAVRVLAGGTGDRCSGLRGGRDSTIRGGRAARDEAVGEILILERRLAGSGQGVQAAV